MTADDGRTDEQLANLAGQGNEGATASLARRYISSTFDLAIRITLDQSLAETVTEVALTRSLEGLQERAPGLGFRSWLFGQVRHEALEGIRQRGRLDAPAEEVTVAPLSPIDDRFAHFADSSVDQELAVWAWQAARAQRPRDYSLLDLTLRRRLPPEEIATITAISRTGIYAVIGRLRGAYEETFTTTILYFRGRADCPELDAIATAAGVLGPAARREISRHADGCPICRNTRSGLPLAADLLASFLDVAPPLNLVARLPVVDAGIPVTPPPPDTAPEAPPSLEDALVADGLASLTGTNGFTAAPAAGAAAAAGEVASEPASEAVDKAEAQVEEGAEAPEDVEAEQVEDATLQAALTALFDDEQPATEPTETEQAQAPEDQEAIPDEPPAEAERTPLPFITPRRGENTPTEGAPRSGGPAAPVPAGAAMVGAGAGAAVARRPTGATLYSRDRLINAPPPRRPSRVTGWFGEGPRRSWLIALVIFGTAIAAYMGVAVGDSLQGGGSKAGGAMPVLPTRAAGVREVACGTAPIDLEQGARATLTFDPTALNGYQVSGVTVRGVSANAAAQAVEARAQQGLTVLFDAFPVGGPPGRVDEYLLTVTFTRDSERTVSECTVRVAVPTNLTTTPTATRTVTPTATVTVAPSATPLVIITAPPATQTPTPQLPEDTATPEPPTNTPQPTATNTRSGTSTPTHTPTPGFGTPSSP
jgi:DNA-directed RNA polymerase specialized sigma24 family protein